MASLARHTHVSQRLLQHLTKSPAPLRKSVFNHPLQISRLFAHHPRQYTTTKPHRHPSPSASQTSEPLIPAPTANTGPLLQRLPNRALPSISPGLSPSTRLWLKTLPLFIALITLASLSIFNYQKSSSSTVNSILYALRTHPQAREILGDEIYFASKVPWISGELNQLHGVIDIRFWVKGTRGRGETRFVSVRKRRDGYFETLEWSLKGADGRVVQLLGEGNDPMAGVGEIE